MNTQEFFSELYQSVPPEKVTYCYTLPRRKCEPFAVGQTEQLAHRAIELSDAENVYFGLHPMDHAPRPGGRARAEEITGVAFLHGEYDIRGHGHQETKLPETQEEILDFLHALEQPPSIIVTSGNGVHTYWLLEDYVPVTEDNRDKIRRIMRGHEKHTHRLAAEHGWKFDTVSDLARILRVPGTLNHKNTPPGRVEVIEANLRRYPLSKFEKYAADSEPFESSQIPFEPDPDRIGPAERIIRRCAFMQHCQEDAGSLPEPEWYAMISNIVLASDGVEAVHVLSEPYLGYAPEETERKIRHALEQKKPHTCRYIREHLGYDCPAEGCGVKAPVVFALYTLEERVSHLLEKSMTAEDVFEEETLSLMAYARVQMPGAYGKFKLRLRRLGISLRDFERAVAHRAEAERTKGAEFNVIKGGPISLPGIDLHGADEPDGFSVSMQDGIQKTALAYGETVMLPVAPEPVVITRKLENVDDGQEKLEITFHRNGRFKSIRIPRSAALNKTQLIRYADSGLPVNSGNAEDMVSYLAAYEAKNNSCIPCARSIDRIGWVGKEFYPYRVDGEMELETDAASVSQMIVGLTQAGSYAEWLRAAEIVRTGCISRAILAGSFASPLLHWLKHRVFLTHVWHDSRGGKTATLKLALAVWGDPVRLLTSYHATAVGLERCCASMKHLPLGLDELQALADKKMAVESVVYSLGNGFGKLRGSRSGGLQKTLQWRNIVLSTGEMPLIRENSMDGVGSRVLELYGRPIADEATARELHQISENHYGHAGKQYIGYLIEEILSEEGKLEGLYREMQRRLREAYGRQHAREPGVHFDNIALLCLGDYISSMSVCALSDEEAWMQAIQLGMDLLENNAQLQPEDSIQRAWDFTVDWIGANRNHFCTAIYGGVMRYGSIALRHVNIIQSVYRRALEEAGFSYAKSIRGFVSRGWFDSFIDADGKRRSQYQCKIDGINMRVFRCKLKVDPDDGCEDAFLN